MTVFAGMRVQAAHDDLGLGDAEAAAKVGMQDGQHLLQPRPIQRPGNVTQGQVRRRECNAQLPGDEHHDGEGGTCDFGEVLGVARESYAAIGDDALGHRRRDHGRELAVKAALGRRAQAVEERRGIAR